ncbi:hypothetical protein ACFT2C_00985 [Promicromonospora sp. NPDC057138]|uniref:hypothetical protein n=1 Tax=Promicromonospora sp. NPDC057138 TaxID=3346031 RepID=UPI00362E8474
MNGAFIVSEDDDLFQQIERFLVARGGSSGDSVAQVSSLDGTLFTVYGDLGKEFEYDLSEEPEEVKGDVAGVPEFSTATSCWAECRSVEKFVEWVRVIAEARSSTTWVLDGNGVLWPDAALDAAQVSL